MYYHVKGGAMRTLLMPKGNCSVTAATAHKSQKTNEVGQKQVQLKLQAAMNGPSHLPARRGYWRALFRRHATATYFDKSLSFEQLFITMVLRLYWSTLMQFQYDTSDLG